MDHIGIDVHKRESQIYILAEGGEVVEQRIRTEGERFAGPSPLTSANTKLTEPRETGVHCPMTQP